MCKKYKDILTMSDETPKMIHNVLIGCTGSVASIKIPELVSRFLSSEEPRFQIKVITTQHATHFFSNDDLPAGAPLLTDDDEWQTWKGRGDPVLHIELNRWADVMVLAPLDANSMAKIANGICDNLLLSAVRAWTITKPLFFCPAMNTKMYEHPITDVQRECLKQWGYHEIPCISKTLMCGDTGLGAMATVESIFQEILAHVTDQSYTANRSLAK